jgi:hypothetical protein
VTLLDAPPVVAATATVRPRRRGTALAAVLALAGLLWTAALLAVPATTDVALGTARLSGDAPSRTLEHYGPRGTHVVRYEHGASLDLTVPVRNDGPLPVTVTAATTASGPFPLLATSAGDALPLRLGPGETRELVLRGVLGNCAYYHEREAQNVEALRLEVRSAVPLAAASTVVLPLDRPLFVRSPMIVRCPDRKIDRQANDRSSAF